jgi:hypothetical protein
MKRLREEKLYRRGAPTWEDFCCAYLQTSKREADCTIRLFDEFGPDYFDLSALTRISPGDLPRYRPGGVGWRAALQWRVHPARARKLS